MSWSIIILDSQALHSTKLVRCELHRTNSSEHDSTVARFYNGVEPSCFINTLYTVIHDSDALSSTELIIWVLYWTTSREVERLRIFTSIKVLQVKKCWETVLSFVPWSQLPFPPSHVQTVMFGRRQFRIVVKDGWFCKTPVERCGGEPPVGRL